MTSPKPFSVGSYIVDSGQIYTIFKIEDDRIFYRASHPIDSRPTVTGSIPLANVQIAGIRTLIEASEIPKFYTELAKFKAKPDGNIDSKGFRDVINTNDPFKIIPLLKQLWITKNTPNVVFSGSNRDFLETMIEHLSLEFSIVTGKTKDSVRQKILATLTK
jgi:RNA polymerase-interacting CarD/CdnL/TRCF family regulator